MVVGWSGFGLSVVGAAGIVVGWFIGYVLLGCRKPSYGWGANRTAACVGEIFDVSVLVLQMAVLALMAVAVLFSVGVGLALLVRRDGQGWVGSWLTASGAVYATVICIQIARAVSLDLDWLTLVSFYSLIAAAVMAVWFALTGTIAGVARAIVRRPTRSGTYS